MRRNSSSRNSKRSTPKNYNPKNKRSMPKNYTAEWNIWDKDYDENIKWAERISQGLMSPEGRFEQWKDIDWLPHEEGWKVLDVGCGNANYHDLFTRGYGMEYTGCDLSLSMLEIARKNYPDVTFIHCDATDLPFADGEFDLVFCSDVLIHLPLDLEEAVVKECIRVAGRYAAIHQRVVLEPPRSFRQDDNGTIYRYEVLDEEVQRMSLFHDKVNMYKRNDRVVAGRPGADIFFIFEV